MFETIKTKAKALRKIYVTGFKMNVLAVKRIFNKIDLDDYNEQYWKLVSESLDASFALVGVEETEGVRAIKEACK